MPRFDLLDVERYNRITVQTTRGCPWRCKFCASSILLTPRYKVKPVAKTIAEIRAIKQLWPHPLIEFADDNSPVNHRHARNLLRALAAADVRWFTETDIAIANDEKLLDLMREEERLVDSTGWERCTIFDVKVRPQSMPVAELEAVLIALGRELYGEEAKRRRQQACKRQWREGRKAAAVARDRRATGAMANA